MSGEEARLQQICRKEGEGFHTRKSSRQGKHTWERYGRVIPPLFVKKSRRNSKKLASRGDTIKRTGKIRAVYTKVKMACARVRSRVRFWATSEQQQSRPYGYGQFY
jgi:hypothetical protein